MSSLEERNWPRRVRALRDRQTREDEGVVVVEGIRQVLAAHESGQQFEAVLVDPSRLRSEIAWEFISELQAAGGPVVHLTPAEFERLSARDNPVGIAAIVRWRPKRLVLGEPPTGSLYLATDNVRDPGNLGTLMRTAEALGVAGMIIHGGTDPGHPTAVRASLGSVFQLPIYAARSLDELFQWANRHGLETVATSAHGTVDLNEAMVGMPTLVLVGNEAEGLTEDTLDRADVAVRIPLTGSATSINVSVAAGIVLYEFRRRLAL